ncbi:cysteine-rich receptor-like protein kinase 34 [Rhodamnia argentea]|uniref:Cysteine-rich receptor-like protein kinase 34 n=1 Tax=Rhodamnia argentea TaxID=178133 RepID=A0ABM3H6E6_9MYRT|nr:cysteine-rich receptor-like protein kinase 34 [Rhodamnia argentea]
MTSTEDDSYFSSSTMERKQPATTRPAQPPSIPLFLLRLPSVLLCLNILTVHLSNAEYCNNTGNFLANGNYAKNRELALSSLARDIASEGGFYSGKVGNGSDVVYVLGFCRGDSSNDTCFKCITSAAEDLMIKCPTQKAASTWGTGGPPCIIRYSDAPMNGVKQTSPTLMLYNTGHIQMDQNEFDPIWRNLNVELAARASMGTSQLKFAVGSTVLPNLQTMFALLQCSPDLSRIDCQSCLLECINNYQGCCHGFQGGVVQKPSCIFRWDLYLFFESNPGNPMSSPPPPTTVTDADPHAPPANRSNPLSSPPPPIAVAKDDSPAPPVNRGNPPSSPPPPTAVAEADPPVPPPANALVPNGNISKSLRIAVVVVGSVVLIVMVVISAHCFIRRRRSNPWMVLSANEEVEIDESSQFKISEIGAATNFFSEGKKIGEGGFRKVYQGKLENGKYIAVKRLQRCSNQGQQHFKNEVTLLVRLQHKNLIKLHGYCLEEGERILILEFAPNGSLDRFISDSINRVLLSWERRFSIIRGIARGLLYLHEDSPLRIIHRDLKPGNVLLDDNMNPRISDFGTARLFVLDQSRDKTAHIEGTSGYMAPEYVRHGEISVKTDVYSFGIVVLEIISGKKNSEHLLSYAWKNWRKGTPFRLVDPMLNASPKSELLRCIQIALLCVQENVARRPTMALVDIMLGSQSTSLAMPTRSAYLTDDSVREMWTSSDNGSSPSTNEAQDRSTSYMTSLSSDRSGLWK